MQFGQPANDRQSDAQTAFGAVQRAIRLSKQIKNIRQQVRPDSNAGIPDAKHDVLPFARALNQISPPGSVYFAEFTSKFESTCSKPIGIGFEKHLLARNVQMQRVPREVNNSVVRFRHARDDFRRR